MTDSIENISLNWLYAATNREDLNVEELALEVRTVYLCYRQNDQPGYVARLCDDITSHYGNVVFRDVDGLLAGQDWRTELAHQISQSRVVVAIIGCRWGDELLSRRGSEEKDYVRYELNKARELDLPVIPVLLDDAVFPDNLTLGNLIWLKDQQLHHLSDRQNRWTFDSKQLVMQIGNFASLEEVSYSCRLKAKFSHLSIAKITSSASIATMMVILALSFFNGSESFGVFNKRSKIEPDRMPLTVASIFPRPIVQQGLSKGQIVVDVSAGNFVARQYFEDVSPLRFVVPVSQKNENHFEVQWSYQKNGEKNITLAKLSKSIFIDSGEKLDKIGSFEYSFDFDEDSDGKNNFEEVSENRNPFSVFEAIVRNNEGDWKVPNNRFSELIDSDQSGDQHYDGGLKSKFSMAHDGNSLYVYLCVNDSNIVADGVGNSDRKNEGGTFSQFWHDDSIEIYINGKHDGDSEWYVDKELFRFVYTPSNKKLVQIRQAKNAGKRACPLDKQLSSVDLKNACDGLPECCSAHNFRTQNLLDVNCSYELDVKLVLSRLGVDVGRKIGFDIEITDDDNGGRRDAKYGWIGSHDITHKDPGTLGAIVLVND